jgi:glycosyltransferase involved in cell wall biosynthesis
MGGDSETGQVATWCRFKRKAFVFSLASDADTDAALPLLRSRRQRMLYRAGLRRADAVIAQTDTQREQLRSAFAVESSVIRNCTHDPGFDSGGLRSRTRNARPSLLWVGRLVPVKRLEVLLDLAAARPEWDFHVVGRGDPALEYVQSLESRARTLSNLALHGAISDEALNERYRNASALVCTSSMEGVPITFLEAWARGLPVVSTVDPDGVIATHGLGAVASAETLGDRVGAVLADDQETLAHRIRAHFLATHTVDAFVSRHEQLLLGVIGRSAMARSHREARA